MLVWAVIVGVLMKILRVEGVGRYYLSTGKTIFQGWRTLGSWTSWYFVPYIVIWGIVYGATAMSSTALPLAALFPALDLKVFAIAAGLIPRLPTEDDGMFYVLALAERYGQAWSVVFLIGFFAASARFYLLMVTFCDHGVVILRSTNLVDSALWHPRRYIHAVPGDHVAVSEQPEALRATPVPQSVVPKCVPGHHRRRLRRRGRLRTLRSARTDLELRSAAPNHAVMLIRASGSRLTMPAHKATGLTGY